MPVRSFLIASTRSSRSVASVIVRGLDLAQLFLGAQIDRAEPFAVAAQLFQIGLDLGQRRQRRLRRDLGEAGDRVRLDLQHVADFALDVVEPAPRAFHPLLGAGAGFARAGQRFQRDLRRAIGLGHRGFGGGQRVGGGAALGFGEFDLADQRAALFGEQHRRFVELFALGRHLGDARLDGGDLRGARPRCASANRCARRRSPAAACRPARPRAPARCASARTCAASRRWPSISVAHRGERDPRSPASAAVRRASRPRSPARLRLRRGRRRAAMRASVSADCRAAWRLISRSVLAWRSRATSTSRRAARSASRAALSAEAAAFSAASAVSSASRLAAASIRACSRSASISASRARSASRRAAPVGACAAATKPSQRQTSPSRDTSRCPVFSCDTSSAPRSFVDHADLRQPARQFRRRGDMVGERLDALGQRRIALAARRYRSSASAPRDRPGRRDRRRARRRAPSHNPWRR